jgi:hypothetical protein
MSYCIPDECIVSDIPHKTRYIAPYVPGEKYTFTHEQQDKYYQMYRDSMFAITQKKGGWDCLRHYEIMANGCIPLFLGIDKCPTCTLEQFPKQLLRDAMENLRPWDEDAYNTEVGKMLEHMRQHLSCSSAASRFLRIMSEKSGKPVKSVLMITGHLGVNYSRELLWIGIKRLLGRDARETPSLDFLYDDYPVSRTSELYGKGFTYSRRIPGNLRSASPGVPIFGQDPDEADILDGISRHKWDVVLYGKIGPDELDEGSIEGMKYWREISSHYSSNEIAFLYGGDECQDMTTENRYSGHLMYHCQRGICFVREINTG